jgi:hypothetical protein
MYVRYCTAQKIKEERKAICTICLQTRKEGKIPFHCNKAKNGKANERTGKQEKRIAIH